VIPLLHFLYTHPIVEGSTATVAPPPHNTAVYIQVVLVPPPPHNTYLTKIKAAVFPHPTNMDASAGPPAGGDSPTTLNGKRKVIESNSESDEDRHVKKISKENAIPADGVVVAPPTITFATLDETALIWREDPVEFNHALAYISLVKSHFASYPEVYQQFISIVYSAKDQEDQDCLSAIVDEVALLFDNQAALLEGFVYFLPQQLQSWVKAKIKVMTQMNSIPEYAPTSEEAGDNVDGGIVLFPTDNDDIQQAVPTPDIDTPINEDAPFSYPYAVGVDYTDENIKRHVDAFYKLVLPIFYLQGCTAKLIDREKYKEIKTALLCHHHRELFATLKKEGYLVIHYWKKIYALVITGDDGDDSNILLVAWPTAHRIECRQNCV
jgi:hypothetical protein